MPLFVGRLSTSSPLLTRNYKEDKAMKKSILNSTQLCFILFFLTCLSILLTARAQAGEPDLAVWLTEHPRVSQAIAWEDSKGITTYPNWSASQKADLYRTFHKVWSAQSLGLIDPPPNMLQLADDERARIVLSEDHAWPLFLAHVSFSLAVETGQWVPWSLTEYSDEALSDLFDGSKMFQWVDDHRGYEPPLRGIPAPPDVTFEFLNEYLMIGQDRLDTIGNLLEWSRAKLRHYTGRFTAENVYYHWQYQGGPPVSRVISGTTRTKNGRGTFSHFTAGCHGTSPFLIWVLRVVNIPVKNVIARGHSLPYFISEGLYLSHADDPYGQITRSAPGFPIEELFIDQATFDTWFGSNSRGACGRQVKDVLLIKYLPTAVLRARCVDFAKGNSREDSYILNNYAGLGTFYSVAELEAINFWDRMDAKIASLGGCPISVTWIDLEPNPPIIQKISDTISATDNLLVVEVRDSEGRAINGHLVTFSVNSGGGTLSAIRTTTDAAGRAETRLTLGPDVGANIVSAIAAGAVEPVTFTIQSMATPDFDGDGIVGVSDFLLFVEQFGFSQNDEGYEVRFDLDGDGVIGIGDFLIFVDSFGKKVS